VGKKRLEKKLANVGGDEKKGLLQHDRPPYAGKTESPVKTQGGERNGKSCGEKLWQREDLQRPASDERVGEGTTN